MTQFNTSELKRYELFGIIISCIGLVVIIATKLPYDPEWFYADYIIGLQGWGWISFLLGAIWITISAMHNRTDFFLLSNSISMDNFIICLFVITSISLLLGLFIPQYLICMGKPDDYVIQASEKNLQRFLFFVIISIGCIFLSFPCIRRFRKR